MEITKLYIRRIIRAKTNNDFFSLTYHYLFSRLHDVYLKYYETVQSKLTVCRVCTSRCNDKIDVLTR